MAKYGWVIVVTVEGSGKAREFREFHVWGLCLSLESLRKFMLGKDGVVYFFSGVHPYLLTFCLDMLFPDISRGCNFGKTQLKYGKSLGKNPFIHSIASL